jgi:hypothetical protein
MRGRRREAEWLRRAHHFITTETNRRRQATHYAAQSAGQLFIISQVKTDRLQQKQNKVNFTTHLHNLDQPNFPDQMNLKLRFLLQQWLNVTNRNNEKIASRRFSKYYQFSIRRNNELNRFFRIVDRFTTHFRNGDRAQEPQVVDSPTLDSSTPHAAHLSIRDSCVSSNAHS